MIAPGRVWWKQQGAASEVIDALSSCAGVKLPTEYVDLLRFSNGGEGPLAVQPYNFCLDSAEVATENKVSRRTEEFFPGFFIFGSSGGGEYIGFDLRAAQPWPIVAIDMTNVDLEESVVPIARDFASFLALAGIEHSA